MEGAAHRVAAKANMPSMQGIRAMKDSKLLGLFFTIAFAVCVAGPAFADGTPNESSARSTRNATPLTRVAACLPLGASCDKGSDCCSANCAPQHHKCAR
jgi:hypothetical protein